MPDLDSFSVTFQPLLSYEQNPLLSDLLLAECNYDLSEVSAMIEPLLNAPKRCQQTGVYIQAVATQYAGFLATNLNKEQPVNVTAIASTWLVGRSTGCAIQIQNRTISRRHAVIGRYSLGFYIADLGSLNGTWVNQQRLKPAQRNVLHDGDVIQLGNLKAEFFLSQPPWTVVNLDETDRQNF